MTKTTKQKVALAIAVVPMMALTACSQSTEASSTSEQFHGNEAVESAGNDSVVYNFSGPATTTPGQSLVIELPETIRTKTPEGKAQPIENYKLTPRKLDSLKLCAVDVKIKWVNDQVPENVWTVRHNDKTYKAGDSLAEGWEITKPEAFTQNLIETGTTLTRSTGDGFIVAVNNARSWDIGEFDEASPQEGTYISGDGHEAIVVSECSTTLDSDDENFSLKFTDFNKPDDSFGYQTLTSVGVATMVNETMGVVERSNMFNKYKRDSSGSWIEK